MKNRRIRLTCLVSFAFALMFASCEEDKSKKEAFRDEGWNFFETGDYTDALEQFQAAIAEDPAFFKAYAGLGWAQLRLEDVDGAESSFEFAQQDDELLDAFSGDAFIKLANNELQAAIDDAEWVLTRKSKYEFKHDGNVDHKDMRLVGAFGYFHLSEYDKALNLVLTLNPDFNENASTSELLQELERLNVEINGNL